MWECIFNAHTWALGPIRSNMRIHDIVCRVFILFEFCAPFWFSLLFYVGKSCRRFVTVPIVLATCYSACKLIFLATFRIWSVFLQDLTFSSSRVLESQATVSFRLYAAFCISLSQFRVSNSPYFCFFTHFMFNSYSVLKMFSRQGDLVLLFISPLIIFRTYFGLCDRAKPESVCVYYWIQWAFKSNVSSFQPLQYFCKLGLVFPFVIFESFLDILISAISQQVFIV